MTEYRSTRNTRIIGIEVPNAVLARATRELLTTDSPFETSGWSSLQPPPELFETLARRMRRLMVAGVDDPTTLPSPEGHLLEQECLRALVAVLHPTESRNPADLPLSSRAVLVDRAEEFMRAHLRDAVGAIDLCASLGVSDRTVRQAFRERYGMGPIVYYKMLRLNAVRASLKAAEPGMVATVARHYGFHHMGNFAADYRRAFGEWPSDTVGAGGSGQRVKTIEVIG
jgi:AraC family ethanolamine operon transcriptional activator